MIGNMIANQAMGSSIGRKVMSSSVGRKVGKGLAVAGTAGNIKRKANALSANKDMGAAARQGNIHSDINNKGKNYQPPQKIASKVHKAYQDMLHMEKEASVAKTVGKGMLYAAGLTIANAGAVGAVRGASKIHSKLKTESMWKELQKRRPDLTNGRKARENFEVLQQFSPDIASNITTLESYMERAHHQMMTPHEFVGDISKIQETRDKGKLSRSIEDSVGHSVSSGVSLAQNDIFHGQKMDMDQKRFDRSNIEFDRSFDQRDLHHTQSFEQRDRHHDSSQRQSAFQFNKTYKQRDDHFGRSQGTQKSQFSKTYNQRERHHADSKEQFNDTYNQRDRHHEDQFNRRSLGGIPFGALPGETVLRKGNMKIPFASTPKRRRMNKRSSLNLKLASLDPRYDNL